MNLNAAQKSAVEYLTGPLLVLAGPGTGKTQLLSARVAHILKNTDTNPENILCITFTESGASNMRERLTSIIGNDASRVRISTYHSFGADILAEYRNYSDTYTRRLDEAIDPVTQQKILRDIQKHLPGTDILRGDPIPDILDTINSAKSARLTTEDLATIARVNIEDSEVLSRVISEFLAKIVPRKLHPTLEDAYLPIYEILKDHENDPPILKHVERNIKSLTTDLKSAVEEATAIDKITPLSAWKDKYFERDEAGNYRLKDRIANKKLASLANIMAKYNQYLHDNGLFDFADMIEEAVTVLKSDPGFRMTLSERYQFIMLDEFQDTNPSQFEIIKQLTDYESPLIMAVGDDDQAIYEFQGASASSLSDFRNHYNAHVINLTENYRSTQEILDFSHKIITQADDRFVDKEQDLGIEKNLHANRPALPVSGIARHDFISADSEYYWVAEQISALIRAGESQKNIAIIIPKYKYISPLLPYLKSHPEINIAYEQRDNLFNNPEIHQLLTTAELIFHIASHDPSAQLLSEVLGYDFWNISPLKVFQMFSRAATKHQSALDYLVESDDPELKTVADFLALLAIRSHDLPLELFINYLVGISKPEGSDFCSPFLKFHQKYGDYDAFKLYEALSVLRKKLRAHLHTERPVLADLMTFLSDYREAGMPLTNTSPYEDATDAVQILSAHKAKGLEFEHVFLIAVDDLSWGKGKGNNNLVSLPKNLTFIRHTGSTDSERIRLFFVAITRAKSHLTMTSSLKDFAGKSPKRLTYLSEFMEGDDKLVSPLLPEPACAPELHYDELDENKKQTSLTTSWLSAYRTLTPEIRGVLKKRLENYRLSPTNLTTFVDISYAGPLAFYQTIIMRSPAPLTTDITYGTLVHATFERITRDGISDEEALEFFRTEAAKSNLPAEDITALIEKGLHALPIALTSFRDIIRTGKAELNFNSARLSVNGVPVTGVIDHLVIDEKAKTIEVYDYKTGKYHSERNWWGVPSLLRYLIQLNFYALLLKSSPTYANYTITRGHILFVEPNRDNKVYDKAYDFNDTDLTLIRQLIVRAYQHIQSLDFIEKDSPLAIESDPDRDAKEISDFINLVLQ